MYGVCVVMGGRYVLWCVWRWEEGRVYGVCGDGRKVGCMVCVW